jgi:K+ transporter
LESLWRKRCGRSRESSEQWKLSLLALGVVYRDIGTSRGKRCASASSATVCTCVPFVNWVLRMVTVGLVCSFRSSSRLASAYGIAVTLSMLITSVLAYSVVRARGWRAARAGSVTLLFVAIELGFLLSCWS